MKALKILCIAAFAFFQSTALTRAVALNDENPLELAKVGAHGLKILSPDLLELTLITTKNPDPASLTQWNFVEKDSQLKLPATTQFSVFSGTNVIAVTKVGFKRRPIYAPLKNRDLRI